MRRAYLVALVEVVILAAVVIVAVMFGGLAL